MRWWCGCVCALRVHQLVVTSSALETLPECLGELARLEVRRLGHTTIEELLVGNRYERKREGYDRITSLPDGIRVQTALKMLNLSGCTGLTGLPERLSALTTLQTLDLRGCSGLGLTDAFIRDACKMDPIVGTR